ncbi:hypothetical protein HYH03_002919 [Edaphochlamys debaryana]|uniref:Protein kinase domain-containing protein n=1 Tax=Edaphochlamys debaryana TaxID=47281 RepID=A0A836C511_9CHLO|nr:hypothetical protein HYH03_002919 [Edaphochlamys debaryana]|eukprot:KAG2499344.1 hypothetical protein HYH03_002919 [Edaphochlamys debaryana]
MVLPPGSNTTSQLGGKYIIRKRIELYKGSVSTVYKCMLADGTPVVVKTYHKAKMAEKHFHKLEREVDAQRLLCRAGTPGVVGLLDSFEDGAAIYLVMECCEGGDLFKRLMLHGGKLPEPWVCCEVVAPLLRVLGRMHAARVMHRDIKPENIFITAEGQVKLGDFGLAIDWTKELPFSRSGTLDYMAPEVLVNPATHTQESAAVSLQLLASKGIRPYTCAVDVWAVGCLAYELVTGRPPFEVEDEKQTASLIIYSNNIKLNIPGTSPAWSDFVAQALTKDPRRRPDAVALLSHPWVRSHLAGETPAAVWPVAAASTAGAVVGLSPPHHPKAVSNPDQPAGAIAAALPPRPAAAAAAGAQLPRAPSSAGNSRASSYCGTAVSGGSSMGGTSSASGASSGAFASGASTGGSSLGGASAASSAAAGRSAPASQPKPATATASTTATTSQTQVLSPQQTVQPPPSAQLLGQGLGQGQGQPQGLVFHPQPYAGAKTPPPAQNPASSSASASVNGDAPFAPHTASVPPQQRAHPGRTATTTAATGTSAAASGNIASNSGSGSGGGVMHGSSSHGALRSLLEAFKSATAIGSNHNNHNNATTSGREAAVPAGSRQNSSSSSAAVPMAYPQLSAASASAQPPRPPPSSSSQPSYQQPSYQQQQPQTAAASQPQARPAVGWQLPYAEPPSTGAGGRVSSSGGSSVAAVVGWRSPAVSPLKERPSPSLSRQGSQLQGVQAASPRGARSLSATAAGASAPGAGAGWDAAAPYMLHSPAMASNQSGSTAGLANAGGFAGRASPQRMVRDPSPGSSESRASSGGGGSGGGGLLSALMRPLASLASGSVCNTTSPSPGPSRPASGLPSAPPSQQQQQGVQPVPSGSVFGPTSPMRGRSLAASPPRQTVAAASPSRQRQQPWQGPAQPAQAQPWQRQALSPPRTGGWVQPEPSAQPAVRSPSPAPVSAPHPPPQRAPSPSPGPAPSIPAHHPHHHGHHHSSSALLDLANSYGAVAAVRVGTPGGNAGRLNAAGSGYTSPQPQRTKPGQGQGQGQGLDAFGLPPPTPGAAGMPDFSPRPAGVLERVKYHLRGGAALEQQPQPQQLHQQSQQLYQYHH